MKVGFKNSFLKALQKLKDEDVKNNSLMPFWMQNSLRV